MNLKSLLDKKGKLLLESEEIIERCELESRELNDDENDEIDEIIEKIKTVQNDIVKCLNQIGKDITEYNLVEVSKANIRDVIKNAHNTVGRSAVKPIGDFVSDDPEMRIYDKRALPELKTRLTGGKSLSLGRAIRGAITGDTKNCTREERDAIGTFAGGGQFMIAEELSGILIPLALEKARIIEAGAKFIVMKENSLLIPQLKKLPDTEFKIENIKFAGDTKAINFSGELLTAKTLVSIAKLSMELAIDGHNIENVVENAMSSAVSLALDKACLLGPGTYPNVRGIVNTEGVLEEDCEFTIESYDHFSNAFYKIEAENGTPSAIISPSSLLHTVDKLKDKDENPLRAPESWGKVRKLSSNQLTDDIAILGGYEHLLIGMRNQATLDITKVAGESFEKMQVWLRIFVRFDCCLGIEKHFCVLRNVSEIAS